MTEKPREHNICGVLIHALPEKAQSVATALNDFDGVEVHELASGGRIVTVVEDTEHTNAIDTLSDIHRLDGIVAAGLVYHHFEPAEEHGSARQED